MTRRRDDVPEWILRGWRRKGPGLIACPGCHNTYSSNALARASHENACDAFLKYWFRAKEETR